MIIGKQNILTWFSSEPDFIYWKIYKAGEKNTGYFIVRSTQEDNLTKNEAYSQLSNALSVLSMGKYEISMQERPGTVVKGSATTSFEIAHNDNNSNTQPQVGAINMAGYISKEEAKQHAEEQFEKFVTKHKLEVAEKENKELKERIKELEDDSNSPLNQIAGMLVPVIAAKMPTVAPAQQPLAAVGTLSTGNENEALEINAEEQQAIQRLQSVLQRVETTFGEPPVPFLEKLLNYIDANPHFVGMIKGFIK